MYVCLYVRVHLCGVSHGFLMGSNVLRDPLWSAMGPHGPLWALMCPYGPLCVLMVAYVSMVSYGPLCVLMVPSRYVCLHVCMYASRRS